MAFCLISSSFLLTFYFVPISKALNPGTSFTPAFCNCSLVCEALYSSSTSDGKSLYLVDNKFISTYCYQVSLHLQLERSIEHLPGKKSLVLSCSTISHNKKDPVETTVKFWKQFSWLGYLTEIILAMVITVCLLLVSGSISCIFISSSISRCSFLMIGTICSSGLERSIKPL